MASIATTIEDLQPSWFTSVLGGEVVSARNELIGTGQVGLVVRSELEHAAGGGPSSVIVKLPSSDAESRRMATLMRFYESEVRFYRELAPKIGQGMPKVFWGDVDPTSGAFTLVMEDLSVTASVGDMVGGGTLQQAERAIGALPAIQAPFWDSPELQKMPWLAPEKTAAMFTAVAPALGAFVERFGPRLPPGHIELAQRLAPQAHAVGELLSEPPFVVAHGDYRLDNMLFGADGSAPGITIIDWQACRLGPPLLDAAIFMSTCVAPDVRRLHERRLLDEYHDELCAAGVSGFTRADCDASYRASSLYTLILTIPASITFQQTERGDAMWAQAYSGAADLALDTDAPALLGR